MNACECYQTLMSSAHWELPVRIWGDSQLIIRHLLGIYKKPSKIRVYDAIQKVKALKRRWKHTSYRHLARDLNKVADDMARRALAAKASVVFYGGAIPPDAPPQQLAEIYHKPARGDDPLITSSFDTYPKFWEHMFGDMSE